MTNKEFYSDKLLAITLKNSCRRLRNVIYDESCVGKNCGDCEFYNVEKIENWLNSEHEESEPSLLENGDNLKPGDWIMVRNNNDSWKKRRFMCYYKGTFTTADGTYDFEINYGTHSDWEQARLPMEGE